MNTLTKNSEMSTRIFSDKQETMQTKRVASPGDSLPPLVKQLYFTKNRKSNLNNIDWIPWKSFLKSGRGSTEINGYKECDVISAEEYFMR